MKKLGWYRRTKRQGRYAKWLAGNDWKRIRASAVAVFGYACAVCGAKPVQFHHMFYAKSWNETKPDHLIPLCKTHHIEAGCRFDKGTVDDANALVDFRGRLVDELSSGIEGHLTRKQLKKIVNASPIISDSGNISLSKNFIRHLYRTSEGRRNWMAKAFGLTGPAGTWMRQRGKKTTISNLIACK